ncbi:hypothetical protein [Pseudoalteromonas sp. S16_S37]|uniref:hypothetical protein n=1 Tax=Pseudoalteromonas sp. S16_S37 TaxID=2720228 RepID=UPI0016811A60|nr:hypothetical protein [Pseudoalteromonas sp. S16_S37]MBD1581938.1 hypothetical protein [Pseudoalteromonas sp. S16_S37]
MSLFRTYNVDSEQQLTLPITFAITLLLLALTLFTFPSQADHADQAVAQETQCTQTPCEDMS